MACEHSISAGVRIATRSSQKEDGMKAERSTKEDTVFYILSGLAAAWAVVCVVSLLMRAK